MPDIQSKIAQLSNKQKNMISIEEKNHSVETDPRTTYMIEFIAKDIKRVIIIILYIFNKVKQVIKR